MRELHESTDPSEPFELHYSCPSCQAQLKAPATLAGTSQDCPHCEETIRLPGIAVPKGSPASQSSSLASSDSIPDSARLRLSCPECGQVLFARGHQVGSTVMCDNCLEDVPVTQASEASQSAPAELDSEVPPLTASEADAEELVLGPELPLEEDRHNSAESTPAVPAGSTAIRLTPEDLVPVAEEDESEAPVARAKPVDQSYDLEDVDLEKVAPTDPLLPADLSLDGLESPDEQKSTDQIMAELGPAAGAGDQRQPASAVQQPQAGGYQFGVNCDLCGTRMIVGSHQIGDDVRCPDCHSHTRIREPAQRDRPVRKAGREPEPSFPAMAPALVRKNPEERIDESRREKAQQVLEKANELLDAEDHAYQLLDEKSWMRAVFSLLRQMDVSVRIVLISVLLVMTLMPLYWATHMPTENQALAIGFLFYVAAAVFAGPCLVACSASLVTVVNQTATGQDDVDDWPGMVSTEWMGTAPYFVVAAMGGAVPLIAWLPLAGGVLPQWLVWYGAVYLSTAVASMVLLSTLGSGSPLLVLSTTVLGSLTLRSRCWFKFLLFLVFWAIGMAAGIYLVQTNRMDGILLGAPLLMLASFLYARTVGVLGYQLSRYRDGDLLDRLHDSMDPEVVD